MIDPKKLRIGNLIKDPILEVEVTAKLLLAFDANKDYADLYEPMNLHIENAKRCGLVKYENQEGGAYLSLDVTSEFGCQISNNHYDGKKTGFYLIDTDGGTIGKEIKYVHQLQNLIIDLEE